MQERVQVNFGKLRDPSSWQVVDATQSKDALHRQLLSLATRAMRDARTKPLRTLWQSPPAPPPAASATGSAATTNSDIST